MEFQVGQEIDLDNETNRYVYYGLPMDRDGNSAHLVPYDTKFTILRLVSDSEAGEYEQNPDKQVLYVEIKSMADDADDSYRRMIGNKVYVHVSKIKPELQNPDGTPTEEALKTMPLDRLIDYTHLGNKDASFWIDQRTMDGDWTEDDVDKAYKSWELRNNKYHSTNEEWKWGGKGFGGVGPAVGGGRSKMRNRADAYWTV